MSTPRPLSAYSIFTLNQNNLGLDQLNFDQNKRTGHDNYSWKWGNTPSLGHWQHYLRNTVRELELPLKFRSEKIPRNRLGTVFVIPRKKMVFLLLGTEFRAFSVPQNRRNSDWMNQNFRRFRVPRKFFFSENGNPTANSVLNKILGFSGTVSWESPSVSAGSAKEEAGEHGEAEQNPHRGETTAPT